MSRGRSSPTRKATSLPPRPRLTRTLFIRSLRPRARTLRRALGVQVIGGRLIAQEDLGAVRLGAVRPDGRRLDALRFEGLTDNPEGQPGGIALAGQHPGEPAHAR